MPLASPGRRIDERPERRQIVLGVVDRLPRIERRGPTQAGGRGRGGALLEVAQIGQTALGGAHHFHGIERRHARPCLHGVHARIGDDQFPAGRGRRRVQQQAFAGHAIVLQREIARELAPVDIEQQRIFKRAARKQSLGQSRQKDHVEGAGARLVDRADEDLPVAARRRLAAQEAQPFGEHAEDFVETRRPDVAHRLQLRQHAQHRFGAAQRVPGDVAQPLDPLAPTGAIGQRGQRLDQRQGEALQFQQRVELALDARGLRLVAIHLGEPQAQLLLQAAQPPRPAIAPAHHRRIHQQLLPGEMRQARFFRALGHGRSAARRSRRTRRPPAPPNRPRASPPEPGRAKDTPRSATPCSLPPRRRAAPETRGRPHPDARCRG